MATLFTNARIFDGLQTEFFTRRGENIDVIMKGGTLFKNRL
ncbi:MULTISPECIES: hypothetical protein [Agrobacterium]|nr:MULTISPECIES: hypothetical protein [Agrobacterium]